MIFSRQNNDILNMRVLTGESKNQCGACATPPSHLGPPWVHRVWHEMKKLARRTLIAMEFGVQRQ